MVSGDSFSHSFVVRPREGGHSQAALHRRAHACPDEMKFRLDTGFEVGVPSYAFFNIQCTELTPTIEEYRTLIGRTTVARDIVESNFHTARPALLSHLLRIWLQSHANPLWPCAPNHVFHPLGFDRFAVVRTRMWTLIGACMRAFGSRGLGVSTFPWGRVPDTRERRSRHLSFYDP
ncbi:hypothetical protein CRG98_019854 [Punica granatum]|uniref:Uncharacterized protein n=1 Tax=Punica granatum TaxID=22663 RepID=A0A2I0JU10_PUNGR|nr:hypothetical protein CRG98_019854 [Punica granatum]